MVQSPSAMLPLSIDQLPLDTSHSCANVLFTIEPPPVSEAMSSESKVLIMPLFGTLDVNVGFAMEEETHETKTQARMTGATTFTNLLCFFKNR